MNIIANNKCWIEQTAVDQLRRVSDLPGVKRAVGLPDLHAGKSPVGIAVVSSLLYPHLIGNDIGCGMGLFHSNIDPRKYRQDRFVTRLNHIRALEDLPTENPYPEECPIYDLGTIGGGNHFAEFQTVERIWNTEAFAALGMEQREILLLVHSGSRGYGQRILQEHADHAGLAPEEKEAKEYLKKHDHALLWAERNRLAVAEKLVEYLGFSRCVETVLDCPHNFVERDGGLFVHRKGATSARRGTVVIPGSRGSLTYLVNPTGDTSLSAHSLSHGAGRKWARSICKSRVGDKYDRDTVRQTALKSRVVCHDTELLYQEAPEAYKSIEQVIASLLEQGLIEVVATLRPLITFKA